MNESFVQFQWILELPFEGFQTSKLDAMLYFSFSKLYEEAKSDSAIPMKMNIQN